MKVPISSGCCLSALLELTFGIVGDMINNPCLIVGYMLTEYRMIVVGCETCQSALTVVCDGDCFVTVIALLMLFWTGNG